MRDTKSTLINRWFTKVWNEGSVQAIDDLMKDDAIAHGITAPGQKPGPEGFKSFFHDFRSQFRNIHIDIQDVITQDDMESARTFVTAEHIPSGKKVEFSGLCMCRIEGGKIAEAWNNYDFLTMHQQLGQKLVPAENA